MTNTPIQVTPEVAFQIVTHILNVPENKKAELRAGLSGETHIQGVDYGTGTPEAMKRAG